ncbi:MAG: sugar ABC transporter permease [Fusobacteriia bacterium 4572_74]|nr:MAG: sugar ABC transporter permease [Fusobacteriia bacterium 4572_74]
MNREKRSILLSCLFMGLGQLYNKYFLKGIVLFIIELLYLIKMPRMIKGIWGIITLGETSQTTKGFQVIQGDHSIFLLIEGVVTIIMLFILLGLYIWNIKDAKRLGHEMDNGKSYMTTKEYLTKVYDRSFVSIMLTPATLGVLFFILLPILVTVLVAFTNYSAPDHIPPRNLVDWVGFKNFIDIFELKIWSKTFIKVGSWTIVWAILSTLLNYSCGLIMALMMNRKNIKFKGFWRTIFILPYAVPAFISLLVFRLLFSGIGPVNNLIASFGFDKIPFLTDPLLAKVSLILINTWLGAPYFMVLLSGSLTNISSSIYEAAEIDGASKWVRFWKITLPLLLFQTAPVLILTFAYNFNNFGAIYLLTNGKPTNSALRYAGETDILITWIFKLTSDQSQFQMAAVISIILFIFIASFSTYQFMKSKSFTEEDMM